MITVAMNMYVQGVDPELNFENMDHIREICERCTKMRVPERQPYSGDLVFTAFSGSHQDAINKGFEYMREKNTVKWMVPYLPINPTDLGREYEPVRINSQSGKGGAAFIMNHKFGVDMHKSIHHEFGSVVQQESDRVGTELKADRIMQLFDEEYRKVDAPYRLVKHAFHEEAMSGESMVTFFGTIDHKGEQFHVNGEGNGPIDAFFNAIHGQKMDTLSFVDYKSHAITNGSDSLGVAYIQLRDDDGNDYFGVGLSHNINLAPLKAILCAINRYEKIKHSV